MLEIQRVVNLVVKYARLKIMLWTEDDDPVAMRIFASDEAISLAGHKCACEEFLVMLDSSLSRVSSSLCNIVSVAWTLKLGTVLTLLSNHQLLIACYCCTSRQPTSKWGREGASLGFPWQAWVLRVSAGTYYACEVGFADCSSEVCKIETCLMLRVKIYPPIVKQSWVIWFAQSSWNFVFITILWCLDYYLKILVSSCWHIFEWHWSV